ncbi:hypothetical protein CYY_006947 [Polysphondylium violaceum]|uniref:Mitofilin n=1 Tax=Polysphondylium violaceum TaxID=133409 RepID=A0A8J4PPG6_9MYCE|nr:hypothetical protein CYY_006947 [Polysphondylium violaceum]
MNNLIKRSTGLLRNHRSNLLFTQSTLGAKRATFSTGSSSNNSNNSNSDKENNDNDTNNNNKNNNSNETTSKLKRNLILTLAGVTVASSALLYFEFLDNKDFMFSSNISNVNKEHLDQFKKVMKDKHTAADTTTATTGADNEKKNNTQDDDQSDEAFVLTNPEGTLEESILIAYEEEKQRKQQKQQQDEQQQQQQQQDEPTPTTSTYGESVENDEINSEEKEMDTISDDQQQQQQQQQQESDDNQEKQTNTSYGEQVENDEINSEEKDLDTITDPVELAEEIVNSIKLTDDEQGEQQEQQEEQEQQEPIEGVIIIAEPIKSPIDEIIEALETKYINNIKSLISENVKLKEELVKLGDAHHEFIIAMEKHLKEKYKQTLDDTIDTVNDEVTKKLTEMEQYYKQLIQDNYKLIQTSVEKQKDNLVGIFNQQVESIKQSEYEKKVISKLASTLVSLQKVLLGKEVYGGDKESLNKSLQDTFNNLVDLSHHDVLIKNLLDNVSKNIVTDGIVDMAKLGNQLKHVAQECRRISLLPNDQSMLGKAISNLAVKFILPSDAVVEGDDTEAILDAAEKHIKEGNLDEAINQISKISKKNSAYLKCTLPWLRSAKQRQEVENISKLLELKLELLQKQQHIIDESKKQN